MYGETNPKIRIVIITTESNTEIGALCFNQYLNIISPYSSPPASSSTVATNSEDLIIERISDREHASVYNGMITKREDEIADLQQKIEESKQFDEVSKRKRNELKTTADLLEKMIEEQHISNANLRLLV